MFRPFLTCVALLTAVSAHAQVAPPSAAPNLPQTGTVLPQPTFSTTLPQPAPNLDEINAALNPLPTQLTNTPVPGFATQPGYGLPQVPVLPSTASEQGFDPDAALRDAKARYAEDRYRRFQHPRQKGQQVQVPVPQGATAAQRAQAPWVEWERVLVEAGVPATKVAFEAQRNPFEAFADWAHRQCMDRAREGTPCALAQ